MKDGTATSWLLNAMSAALTRIAVASSDGQFALNQRDDAVRDVRRMVRDTLDSVNKGLIIQTIGRAQAQLAI